MKTIRDHQHAVDVVASIPVHWNADGSVKHHLLDREDAELVVRALLDAELLRPAPSSPENVGEEA